MAMEAGRELDALVAEKVMECEVLRPEHSDDLQLCGCENGDHAISKHQARDGYLVLRLYSTDITAAWEIHEKMLSLDRNCQRYYNYVERLKDYDAFFHPAGETACFICLAALKAMGVKM